MTAANQLFWEYTGYKLLLLARNWYIFFLEKGKYAEFVKDHR